MAAALAVLVLCAAPARAEQEDDGRAVPAWKSAYTSLPHLEQVQDRFDAAMKRRAAVITEPDPRRRRELWREVLDEFEALRKEHGDTLYYFADRAVYVGLGAMIHEQLAALPEEGLERYRARHDDPARRLAARAAAEQDPRLLERLLREHPFAGAAVEALAALGDRAFEAGRFAAALEYYRELARFHAPEAGDRLAPALARAGVAAWELDDRESLQWLARRALATRADARVQVGDEQQALVAFLETLARRAPTRRPRVARWAAPTGGANGVFEADEDPSPGEMVWRAVLPPVAAPTESRSPGWIGGRFFVGAQFPGARPALGAGAVYVNTGATVAAYNLFNGRLKWLHRVTYTPREYRFAERDPKELTAPVVADDRVYACVEEPLRERPETYARLYLVSLPPIYRRLVCFDAETGAIRWRRGGPGDEDPDLARVSFNQAPIVCDDELLAVASLRRTDERLYLYSFDAETGALRGRLFLCSGQQEINMFGWPIRESFPAPLVARQGRLYVATNLGAVIAVDLRARAIAWAATYPVAPVEPPDNFTPILRPTTWANNSPVLARGVLAITPTDSDLALGYDADRGALRWRLPRRFLWAGGTAGGGPSGGGEGTWSELRFAAGGADGTLYLAGALVAAVNIETGARTALAAPPDGAAVAGAPALSARALYCPTERGTVLRFERRALDRPPDVFAAPLAGTGAGCHLAAADHALVAVADDAVGLWYDAGRLFDQARRRVQAAPDDPFAQLELAHLSAQRGQPEEAQRAFEAARRLAAREPGRYGPTLERRARDGLTAVALQQAAAFAEAAQGAEGEAQRAAWRGALAQYERALAVVVRPDEEVEILRRQAELWQALAAAGGPDADAADAACRRVLDLLGQRHRHRRATFPEYGELQVGLYAEVALARWHEARGRPDAALERWQAVIADFPEDRILQYRAAAVFARERIEALIARHGRALYAPFEARARQLLDQSRASGSVAGLAAVLERFPNAAVVEETVLALVEALLAQGRPREAAGQLQRFLRDFPARDLRPRLLARLTHAWQQLGMEAARRVTLDALALEAPDAPVGTPDAPERAAAFLARRRAAPPPAWWLPADGRAARVPLEVPAGRAWEQTDDTVQYLQVLRAEGVRDPAQEAWFFVLADAALEIRRVADGALVDRAHQFGTRLHLIQWVGRDLLIVGQQRAALLDARTRRPRWSLDQSQVDVRQCAYRRGLLALVLAGTGAPGGGAGGGAFAHLLRLLDVPSGEVVWERPVFGQHFTQEPLIGDAVLVVPGLNPAFVKSFELVSGAERCSWEPAGKALTGTPRLGPDDLLALPYDLAEVQVLDARRGELRHRLAFTGGSLRQTAIEGGDLVVWLVESGRGHLVQCYRLTDGTRRWERVLGTQVQAGLVALEALPEGWYVQWREYQQGGQAEATLLDPADGRPRWRRPLVNDPNLRPFAPRFGGALIADLSIATDMRPLAGPPDQPPVLQATYRVILSVRRLADGAELFRDSVATERYPPLDPRHAPFVDDGLVLAVDQRIIGYRARDARPR